jgi:hypothetical protein
MRHGNRSESMPVERFDERLRRLAGEFLELERLRLDVRIAEELVKRRQAGAQRTDRTVNRSRVFVQRGSVFNNN